MIHVGVFRSEAESARLLRGKRDGDYATVVSSITENSKVNGVVLCKRNGEVVREEIENVPCADFLSGESTDGQKIIASETVRNFRELEPFAENVFKPLKAGMCGEFEVPSTSCSAARRKERGPIDPICTLTSSSSWPTLRRTPIRPRCRWLVHSGDQSAYMVPLAGAPEKSFASCFTRSDAPNRAPTQTRKNKKTKKRPKKRRRCGYISPEKKRMAEKIGRDMFVTTDDGKKLTTGSMVAIHEVVERFVASTVAEMSYVVKRDFGRIFVTSDVHADLRKFVEILVSLGLVTGNSDKPMDRGDIYEYVWDLEWNADDTMLMITGDLIDGKRGHRIVDDPRGSYEMLLHILLFNLRIGARARNSDVLFVIGNHDMYSVVLPREFRDQAAWQSFSSPSHVAFAPAGSDEPWIQRATMLAPFYLCSPYLMVRLGSVLFVHGGLLDRKHVIEGKNEKSIYKMALEAQMRIHANMSEAYGAIGAIGPYGPSGPAGLDGAIGHIGPMGPVGLRGMREAIKKYIDYACSVDSGLKCANVTEVRGYAELERGDICTNGETMRLVHDEKVTLVVVGHCVTHTLKVRTVNEDGDEEGTVEAMRPGCEMSEGDSKSGCVAYVKCKDARSRGMDALMVAFVDVAMSQCFRVRDNNNTRPVEVLKMIRVQEERDVRGHGVGVWYEVGASILGGFTVHV